MDTEPGPSGRENVRVREHADWASRLREPMSTNDRAGLETRHDDRTVRRGLIGLDAEGGVHEIDPTTRTVYVRGHDGVEHTEELGERDVSEWVAYVDERRGWDDLRYVDDPLAGIVESAAEATEAQ